MQNKIPNDFLDCCIDSETGEVYDSDSITEAVLIETAELGDFVNSVVFSAVKAVVETYVVPEAEEYAKDYFEPSAREEAMADIRRETMERIKNESY